MLELNKGLCFPQNASNKSAKKEPKVQGKQIRSGTLKDRKNN